MLGGEYSEGSTNSVTLSEDEPEVFQLYVQWLYVGRFEYRKDPPHALRSAQAWVLGDKLQCEAFRDHAMVQLIRFHRDVAEPNFPLGKPPRKNVLDTSTLHCAYENSLPGSNLRAWALDCFVRQSVEYRLVHDAKKWGELAQTLDDFAADLAHAFAKQSPTGNATDNGEEFLDLLSYASEIRKLVSK
ncbi:MAG: hypothetical protein Q9163_003001 [Psora crenata]